MTKNKTAFFFSRRYFFVVSFSSFVCILLVSSGELNASQATTQSPAPHCENGKMYPGEQSITSNPPLVTLPFPAYLVSTTLSDLNTSIVRISDASTFGSGQRFYRHYYSKQQPWNSDGTRLILSHDSSKVYFLDGQTYAYQSTSMNVPEYPKWSNSDPDLMYGVDNVSFVKYTPSTGVKQTLKTFPEFSSMWLGIGEGNLSDDDRYAPLIGKYASGLTVIIYDTVNDVEVSRKQFNGATTSTLDWASLSPSGQYVVVNIYDGASQAPVYDVYDIQMNFLRRLDVYAGGHADIGYDIDGNEVIVSAHFEGGKGVITTTTRLSDNITTQQLPGIAQPAGIYQASNYHISCRNINRPGYCYISNFAFGSAADAYMFHEVFALKLDGSGTVERFSQDFAALFPVADLAYSRGSMVVPDRDGARVLFASDWGDPSTGATIYDYVAGVTEASATSTCPGADITPPTKPTIQSATPVSDSQINLAWIESTDNIGVTGYHVERCIGTSCTDFIQTATTQSASYQSTGLVANTTYRYRVRATDVAGNLSVYSSVVDAQTLASGGDITSGLVSHWKFDGSMVNSTGLNDGVFNGGAPSYTTGMQNQAINFDGVDDSINVGSDSSLALTEFSVSMWFTWRSEHPDDAYRVLISKDDTGTGYYDNYMLSVLDSNHTMQARVGCGTVCTENYAYGTSAVDDNQWHHAVLTYSSSAGIMALYVDGQQEDYDSGMPTAFTDVTVPTTIGYWQIPYGEWDGLIDDVRIYNRALSQVDVTSLYNYTDKDTFPPSTPAMLYSASVSTTHVNLSWIASTDTGGSGLRGYRVERCQGSSCVNFAEIAQPTTNAYSNAGLNPNTVYRYRVRAEDNAAPPNFSEYSNVVAALTQSTSDTTAPVIINLNTSDITPTHATITWNTDEPATTQLGYGLSSCTNQSTTEDTTLVTSHNVSLLSLSSDTTYYYCAYAKDASNNSSMSSQQVYQTLPSAVTDTSAPTTITDLTVTRRRKGSMKLQWTATGDDGSIGTAALYDIRYSTSPITELTWDSASQATGEPTPSIAGTIQNYNLTGLNKKTSYHVAIKAVDEAGNSSPLSNTVFAQDTSNFSSLASPVGAFAQATIVTDEPDDTTPPASPTNFVARGANRQIILSWSNPSDSDFVRTILVRNSYPPTSVADGTILYEGTGEMFIDTKVTSDTSYHYTLFSFDTSVNYSSPARATANAVSGVYSVSFTANATPSFPPTPQKYVFSRNLRLGMSGEDVKELQVFLNQKGFVVANQRAGSPGNETTYFGSLTKDAVVRFQEQYPDEILAPHGLSKGNGFFGPNTRGHINNGLLHRAVPILPTTANSSTQEKMQTLRNQIDALLLQVQALQAQISG